MEIKTYVRTQKDFPSAGVETVVEVVATDKDINTLYHPDFVALLIDVTDQSPMPGEWWTYSGGVFYPPE